MKILLYFLIAINIFANNFFYEFDKKVELTPIKSRNLNDTNVYKTDNGEIVKIKNQIIVKLKKNTNPTDFFKKYNIDNIKKISKNVFLISNIKENIFEFSQKLYNDDNTVYAIPNRIKKYKRR